VPVVTRDRRGPATFTLLGVIGGAVLLPLAPLDLATVRLGPLSLTWWYAVVSSIAAAVVAVVALASRE
jgi:hypothetical protein